MSAQLIDVKITLRELREKKHLTQEQLAKISGVSTSYISALELQKRIPTILTLIQLAKALDVKISELVSIEENGCQCKFKYF